MNFGIKNHFRFLDKTSKRVSERNEFQVANQIRVLMVFLVRREWDIVNSYTTSTSG